MTTPYWPDYRAVDMDDWGASKTAISGAPHAHGKILAVNPDGSSECGVWSCTPGERRLVFENDEFCYFLGGRGAYIHDNGRRSRSMPAPSSSSRKAGSAAPSLRKPSPKPS